MTNKIGSKIKFLREQRGFSQDNLAMELGISQPSYARLEKKDSRISITRLIHISQLLKTTVSDLVEDKSQKNANQQVSKNTNVYLDNSNADKEHIQSLKEENAFLKQLLSRIVK